MLATVPLDLIENGQRLRDISEATVASLINSIADVGLLNPITLFPKKVLRGGTWVDGYGLIAGLHRKTAYERLGLVEIEANILALDDLDRQIAECDENLCAPQLSPADRAMFTKRRKDAYEAKHPETRAGVAGGKARQGAAADNLSFAADTAAATGVDERTVRRDAERGEKISDEALQLVRGTRFDTGVYLNSIKAMSPDEQLARVKQDVAVTKRPAALPSLQSMQRIKLDADIRLRAARECAELLGERLRPEDLAHFHSNASLISMKDLLTELANVAGNVGRSAA